MAKEFTHLDLLSPYPIFLDGVGHIISPQLKKIVLSGGEQTYNGFMSVLLLTKVQLLEQLASIVDEAVLKELDKMQLFELLMCVDDVRRALVESLEFCLVERVRFDKETMTLVTYKADGAKTPGELTEVGRITNDNYYQVREVILRRNYITPPAATEGKRRSKRMIEFDKKLEEGRKKSKRYKEDQRAMQLGNIASKISSYSNLNILNVFDLTVYQLYDQFFEINNQVQLSAATHRWCIWGKEKFDFSLWYKATSDK